MKNIYLRSKINLILTIILVLLLVYSCKKEWSWEQPPTKAELIDEAKDFFEQNVLTNNLSIPNDQNYRHNISKYPDWKRATIKHISIGNAVIVPLIFNKRAYFKKDKDSDTALPLEKTSYLMVYKNQKDKMKAEWVTMIPENLKPSESVNFKGIVVVEDWYGNFIKAYAYNRQKLTQRVMRTESVMYKASFKSSVSCYSIPIYNYNYVPTMPELGYSYYLAGYEVYCYGNWGDEVGGGSSEDEDFAGGSGNDSAGSGDYTANIDCAGVVGGTAYQTECGCFSGNSGVTDCSAVNINNFVIDLTTKAKYPKFTTLLKNLKSFVKNDTKVLEALKQWSGFSETEILSKVEFGQGPKIIVKELTDKYGYFNKSENPNVINIDASWVRGLETANLLSTKQATGFLLAVTILHEFVHQARASNGLDTNKYEYGIGFENSAFGLVIEKTNAGDYSYRFYGK